MSGLHHVDLYSRLPGKVKYIAQTQRAYTALVTVAVGAAWRCVSNPAMVFCLTPVRQSVLVEVTLASSGGPIVLRPWESDLHQSEGKISCCKDCYSDLAERCVLHPHQGGEVEGAHEHAQQDCLYGHGHLGDSCRIGTVTIPDQKLQNQ